MTSKYQDIYSRFLRKIEDYEFANWQEEDAEKIMNEWLQSALSNPYVLRIFKSFSSNDDFGECDYTLADSVNDYVDKNFAEELLSYQMIIEWMTPKVNTLTLINQMVTNSKEEKFYAQSNHLSEMRKLLSDSENKVRSMLRDRGYIYNTYLGNTK